MLMHIHIKELKFYKQGFTLVEMMVTITILVIALGVSIPSMTSWISTSQLKAASHTLKSALRSAQSQAQSQSRMVALIFTNTSISGNSIDTKEIKGNLTHWATYNIPIDGSTEEEARLLQIGALHSDKKITAKLSDGGAICFNGLGRLNRQSKEIEANKPIETICSSKATVTLMHANQADKSATLTVSSGGKIEINQ